MQKNLRILTISLLVSGLFSVSSAYSDSVDDTVTLTVSAKDAIISTPVKNTVSAPPAPVLTPTPTAPVLTKVAPAPEHVSVATCTAPVKKAVHTKVEVGGGAYFLDRKNYKLIQPQDETQNVATQTVGNPNEFDTQGLGSFGDILVEHTIDGDFSLAASFLGATLENDDYRGVQAGTDQGVGGLIKRASVIPLLNELGKQTIIGGAANGSAIEIGGKPNDLNSLADAYFSYESQQFDVAVDVIRNNLYICKDLQIDGIIGWGFSHVNQDFELATRGINVNNAGVVTTKTVESLQDNLFGGRVGMRSRKHLFGKIDLTCKLIGGFYNDAVNYTGSQSFRNASFAGRGAVNNFDVLQDLSANRFVPRLDTETSLIYPLSSQLQIAASYRFDVLWGLSNIDHPSVIFKNAGAASTDEIDHPVRLGTETVAQHYMELKLAYKF